MLLFMAMSDDDYENDDVDDDGGDDDGLDTMSIRSMFCGVPITKHDGILG